MASGPRPTARPGAGPGRGRSRSRTTSRTPATRTPASKAAGKPTGSKPVDEPAAVAAPVRRRRGNVTTRAIALAVVVAILVISYANSVRIYLAQTHQIAATQAEIAERQQAIAALQQQVGQWDDPAFVATQARDRLGWVKPGETGYTVVDSEGRPLGGGTSISTPIEPAEVPEAWYAKLWGSVEKADEPVKAPVKPKKQKPLTEDSEPSTGPR